MLFDVRKKVIAVADVLQDLKYLRTVISSYNTYPSVSYDICLVVDSIDNAWEDTLNHEGFYVLDRQRYMSEYGLSVV